jgi:hypothetical protein
MRWIDFENKQPTEAISGWLPWSQEKWQAWLAESHRLHRLVRVLNNEANTLADTGQQQQSRAKLEARNEVIDDNDDHWSDLKPWLFALSHGKCWFTEARDIASHQDVEHFRPKKEAKDLDGSTRDGYWWLAFEYSNFRAAGNVPNRKKGGWFPLHKDSALSTFEARCEENETPYLLDPIRQTDVDLLAFDEEGNAIAAPDKCYRLLLLPSIESIQELPNTGVSLAVVAQLQEKLCIRAFDETTKCLISLQDEPTGKGSEIGRLKQTLSGLWNAKSLSHSDRCLVLKQVGDVIGHTLQTWEEERVSVSILRLKLNEHDALPRERRRVWKEVTTSIENYLTAKSKYRPGINPAPLEKMEIYLRQIRQKTREDAELSAVALWCVRFRNDSQLLRLIS